jgi:transcriptional regulator with XRE-family HTH domain
MLKIGENIQKLLAQNADIDLAGLSRYAHVGSRRLERIVKKETLPSVAELERIANALGVSPSLLVESEAEPLVDGEVDPQVVELLENPTLAAALWYLSELPSEDRDAVFKVIERFAVTG